MTMWQILLGVCRIIHLKTVPLFFLIFRHQPRETRHVVPNVWSRQKSERGQERKKLAVLHDRVNKTGQYHSLSYWAAETEASHIMLSLNLLKLRAALNRVPWSMFQGGASVFERDWLTILSLSTPFRSLASEIQQNLPKEENHTKNIQL